MLPRIGNLPTKTSADMFTTSTAINCYENISQYGISSDLDMAARQDRLHLQISPTTPTRNTIRTSPHAHIIQPNHHSMSISTPTSSSSASQTSGVNVSRGATASDVQYSSYEMNYSNAFNFTDDCNFQGKN